MAVETPPQSGQLPSSPVVRDGARRTNHRTARLVAIIAGLLGAALALATPFLPVKQTTAQLNWPQNGVLQSVNAPLIGYVATDLDINIPCSAAAGLAGPQNAGRTVLLSTVPKQAPKAIDRGLLIERVNNDLLVIVRNTPVVTAPLSQVLSPACEKLTFTAHADKVTGEFVGLVKGPDTDDPGAPLRGERSGYDFRPQIVGVFTDLAGPAPPGLQFSATVDSRYSTSPTLLKMIVMIVGVAMTIIALGALHVLDTADGMRHRRFLPPRWWTIRPLDALVTAVLVWWHFVGANTSDDGYILTMARVSEHAGYMANYYRWFGTPEAPFGWYYDLLALWAHVSTNSVWVRLPTLLMALTCWWVISREVIPRLGHAVKTNPAAAWTAAGMFLAFWLPLNNGLRPEPIIALGILLTWCSVERGVATSRVLPVAIAIIIGALTLFSGPTGIAAVGALLVAVGPLKTIVASHTSRFGYLALLAPVLAACTVTIILIFRDQTFAAEMQASTFKSAVGPSLAWFDEHIRYERLFMATPDGSVARRFARADGAARTGGVGGNDVAQGQDSRHRRGAEPSHRRHHHHLVPGHDVHADQVDPPLRGVRGPRRIAWRTRRRRRDRRGHEVAAQPGDVRGRRAVRDGVVVRQRQRLLVRLELRCAVVEPVPGVEIRVHHDPARFGCCGSADCCLVPLLRPRPFAARCGHRPLLANRSVAVGNRGMADGHVRSALPDPSHGRPVSRVDGGPLQPRRSRRKALWPGGLRDGRAESQRRHADSGGRTGRRRPRRDHYEGFGPNNIPTNLSADEVMGGGPGTSSNFADTAQGDEDETSSQAGTEGGTTAGAGVNGSRARLPFNLDPARTPVMGSWRSGTQQPAVLRSAWYRLPADWSERDRSSSILVVSAAGRFDRGDVIVQWAGDDGEPKGAVGFADVGAPPAWRNLRAPLTAIPADATQVRLVVTDDDLSPQHWMAVTPPRIPHLRDAAGGRRLSRTRCCWTGWSGWPSRASARTATRTASSRCRSGASCPTGSAPRRTRR